MAQELATATFFTFCRSRPAPGKDQGVHPAAGEGQRQAVPRPPGSGRKGGSSVISGIKAETNCRNSAASNGASHLFDGSPSPSSFPPRNRRSPVSPRRGFFFSGSGAAERVAVIRGHPAAKDSKFSSPCCEAFPLTAHAFRLDLQEVGRLHLGLTDRTPRRHRQGSRGLLDPATCRALALFPT